MKKRKRKKENSVENMLSEFVAGSLPDNESSLVAKALESDHAIKDAVEYERILHRKTQQFFSEAEFQFSSYKITNRVLSLSERNEVEKPPERFRRRIAVGLAAMIVLATLLFITVPHRTKTMVFDYGKLPESFMINIETEEDIVIQWTYFYEDKESS